MIGNQSENNKEYTEELIKKLKTAYEQNPFHDMSKTIDSALGSHFHEDKSFEDIIFPFLQIGDFLLEIKKKDLFFRTYKRFYGYLNKHSPNNEDLFNELIKYLKLLIKEKKLSAAEMKPRLINIINDLWENFSSISYSYLVQCLKGLYIEENQLDEGIEYTQELITKIIDIYHESKAIYQIGKIVVELSKLNKQLNNCLHFFASLLKMKDIKKSELFNYNILSLVNEVLLEILKGEKGLEFIMQRKESLLEQTIIDYEGEMNFLYDCYILNSTLKLVVDMLHTYNDHIPKRVVRFNKKKIEAIENDKKPKLEECIETFKKKINANNTNENKEAIFAIVNCLVNYYRFELTRNKEKDKKVKMYQVDKMETKSEPIKFFTSELKRRTNKDQLFFFAGLVKDFSLKMINREFSELNDYLKEAIVKSFKEEEEDFTKLEIVIELIGKFQETNQVQIGNLSLLIKLLLFHKEEIKKDMNKTFQLAYKIIAEKFSSIFEFDLEINESEVSFKLSDEEKKKNVHYNSFLANYYFEVKKNEEAKTNALKIIETRDSLESLNENPDIHVLNAYIMLLKLEKKEENKEKFVEKIKELMNDFEVKDSLKHFFAVKPKYFDFVVEALFNQIRENRFKGKYTEAIYLLKFCHKISDYNQEEDAFKAKIYNMIGMTYNDIEDDDSYTWFINARKEGNISKEELANFYIGSFEYFKHQDKYKLEIEDLDLEDEEEENNIVASKLIILKALSSEKGEDKINFFEIYLDKNKDPKKENVLEYLDVVKKLSELNIGKDNYQEALNHLEEGSELLNKFGIQNKQAFDIYNSLSIVYENKENLEKAFEFLTKKFKIEKSLFRENKERLSLTALKISSIVYKLGKIKESLNYAEDSLTLDPDNEEAKEKIESLTKEGTIEKNFEIVNTQRFVKESKTDEEEEVQCDKSQEKETTKKNFEIVNTQSFVIKSKTEEVQYDESQESLSIENKVNIGLVSVKSLWWKDIERKKEELKTALSFLEDNYNFSTKGVKFLEESIKSLTNKKKLLLNQKKEFSGFMNYFKGVEKLIEGEKELDLIEIGSKLEKVDVLKASQACSTGDKFSYFFENEVLGDLKALSEQILQTKQEEIKETKEEEGDTINENSLKEIDKDPNLVVQDNTEGGDSY